MFCFTCLGGRGKRICPVCKKRKDMSLIEIEHIEYLLATWYKLRKFKMKSTGVESVDMEVLREFGSWERNTAPYIV